MGPRVDTLRQELAERAAARRRLPWPLKILVPFTALSCVFATLAVLVVAIGTVHSWLRPEAGHGAAEGAAQAMIFFGSFLASVGPGLIFANLTLWAIPPVRRALDHNAAGVTRGSFQDSNGGLLLASAILGPAGLVLAAIGAIQPWLHGR
jgi:hypothetical protein